MGAIYRILGIDPSAEQVAAQIRANHQAREERHARQLRYAMNPLPIGTNVYHAIEAYQIGAGLLWRAPMARTAEVCADESLERHEFATWLSDFEWVIDILDMAPNADQLTASRPEHEVAMARIRDYVQRLRLYWHEIVGDAMLRNLRHKYAATRIQRRFRRWPTGRRCAAATQIRGGFAVRHSAATRIQCRIRQRLLVVRVAAATQHSAATVIQCRFRQWRTVVRFALLIVNWRYKETRGDDNPLTRNALTVSKTLRELLSNIGFHTPKVKQASHHSPSPLNLHRVMQSVKAAVPLPTLEPQPLKNLVNKAQMEKTIENFIARIWCKAEICLAFIGHGADVDGEAFLAPTEADWKSGNRVELVGLRGVMALFNARGKKIQRQLKVIFLLDCCRTYPKYNASASKSKAHVDRPRWEHMQWAQFYIIYAAGPGHPAYIGADGYSLTSTFTTEVSSLQQRACRKLNLEYLVYCVRRALIKREKCQISWSHDCLRAPLGPYLLFDNDPHSGPFGCRLSDA